MTLILGPLCGALSPDSLSGVTERLGPRIRRIREARGIGMNALARSANYEDTNLSRVERDLRPAATIEAGSLAAIAVALGMRLDDLIRGTELPTVDAPAPPAALEEALKGLVDLPEQVRAWLRSGSGWPPGWEGYTASDWEALAGWAERRLRTVSPAAAATSLVKNLAPAAEPQPRTPMSQAAEPLATRGDRNEALARGKKETATKSGGKKGAR